MIMQHPVQIPVHSLTPDTIREIKEQFPDGIIKVEMPRNEAKSFLSQEDFWELIGLLDWSKAGSDDRVLAPAVEALSARSNKEILGFAEHLADCLYQLDTRDHAKHIGTGSWKEGGYFSSDHFLGSRAVVVANGKGAFEAILSTPSKMPKDLTFEALVRLAPMAYKKRTGRDWSYTTVRSYETYSNILGWK